MTDDELLALSPEDRQNRIKEQAAAADTVIFQQNDELLNEIEKINEPKTIKVKTDDSNALTRNRGFGDLIIWLPVIFIILIFVFR